MNPLPTKRGSSPILTAACSGWSVSYEFIPGTLTGLLGLRHFDDERSWPESQTVGELYIPYPEREGGFDSINPRLNLAYTPTANSLYFFNAAKGFRSGISNAVSVCASLGDPTGANRPDLVPFCAPFIDSDELWSYEIGTKHRLNNGALVIDATLYYQDWKDIQGRIGIGTISTSFEYGDADGARLDVSITWSPEAVPGLNLAAGANWNDMKFSSLDPVVADLFGTYLKPGDRLPTVPPFSSALSISYGAPLGDQISGEVSVSWNHKASHPASPGAIIEADHRNYVNLRAGLTGDRFGFYLTATNLLDARGITFGQDGPFYAGQLRLIDPPRLYAVEWTYDF